MDWAISSRALNRGRFNDYPFVDEISTIGVGLLLEVGENPLNRSTGLPLTLGDDIVYSLINIGKPRVLRIIDTVDIAYDYAENYICANAGVDTIADIGYGKGYTMVAKEFDSALRSIVQMDYGLVLISHAIDKTFTDESGKEYNQIVPTLSSKPRNIVSRMSDIIGYTRSIEVDGVNTVKMFMRGTPRFVAGSRFKYTPDYIDFTYNDLVNAINDAIDKQAAEDGQEFFTNSRQNLHSGVASAPDFDSLMEEFKTIVANIPGSADPKCETEEGQKFKEYWMPRIIEITDRYLGKGKKVNQCTRDQVEALDLIVTELKDLTHMQ